MVWGVGLVKQAASVAAFLLVLVVGCHLVGCSGPGAPTHSAEFGALEAVAHYHLTALLHVRRWFAILYPAAGTDRCPTYARRIKPEPDDPPGAMRMRMRLSDCTVIDVLQFADGSGTQVVTFADGQQKTVSWGVERREPGWVKQDVTEALWDGHRLAYEIGISTAGDPLDRYERGVATLANSHAMQFRHARNLNRDAVKLRPDDGSELRFEVPLQSVNGAPFNPVYEAGATGTFTTAGGYTHAFAVMGTEAGGWVTWAISAPDGITGRFALGTDLAGRGTLWDEGEVAALLTWSADGQGTLTPLGAADIPTTPSAAARDFRIDDWIRNVAALGPTPTY